MSSKVSEVPENIARSRELAEVQHRKSPDSASEKDWKVMFEAILEGTMAGYWDWHIPEDYEYMSPTFKQMFGYEDHEIPNNPKAWQILIHPDDLPGVFQVFEEHVQSRGKIPFENIVRYYHKDGSIIWVFCRGKVIEWDHHGNPQRMVGSHVDITELKEAQMNLIESQRDLEGHVAERTAELELANEALHKSQQQYEELYNNAPDIFLSVNPNTGKIMRCNPTLAEKLGDKTENFVGQSLLKIYHPDCHEAVQTAFNEFKATGRVEHAELELRRHDNSKIPIHLKVTSVKDKDGNILYSNSILRDISDIKDMENELIQQARELTFANQELESFSYAVSHDLRAPLRHMSGFLEALWQQSVTSLDEKGRRYLEVAIDSGNEMEQLIEDLLAFSRTGRTSIKKQLLDFGLLVEESLAKFEAETKKRHIEWQIQSFPKVNGDEALLRQVVFNLLSNAVKYTRNCRKPLIEVGCFESADPKEGLNDAITFFVRDNGAGFDMTYRNKLFGVFQRLHCAEEFDGTGIGLANVKRIISRHGGQVWAEGVVNEGATFYFTLPVNGKPARMNNGSEAEANTTS